MNRRTQARRRSDRQFLHLLIGGALLTFLLGCSVGYFVAMKQCSSAVKTDSLSGSIDYWNDCEGSLIKDVRECYGDD